MHEFVTDVLSKWPLYTAECEGSDNKLQDETGNPSMSHILLASPLSHQKQLTQRGGCWRIRPRTFSESRLATRHADTLLQHSDMDKMAVDKWRPKLANSSCFHDP